MQWPLSAREGHVVTTHIKSSCECSGQYRCCVEIRGISQSCTEQVRCPIVTPSVTVAKTKAIINLAFKLNKKEGKTYSVCHLPEFQSSSTFCMHGSSTLDLVQPSEDFYHIVQIEDGCIAHLLHGGVLKPLHVPLHLQGANIEKVHPRQLRHQEQNF